jgi:hypothetical protein
MKREDVFERLDPPPGGLAELRERMTARPSPSFLRGRHLFPVAAALAVAAVVLLVWSRRDPTPDLVSAARERGGLEQVTLGLAPAPATSASVTDDERATTALTEVPTSNRTVAFYWVSSTTWTE